MTEHDDNVGGPPGDRPRRFSAQDPNGNHEDAGELRELTPDELAALADTTGGEAPKVPAEPEDQADEAEEDE
jgi:hypothetical protein